MIGAQGRSFVVEPLRFPIQISSRSHTMSSMKLAMEKQLRSPPSRVIASDSSYRHLDLWSSSLPVGEVYRSFLSTDRNFPIMVIALDLYRTW
jgi:hypothetical protein